MGQVTAVGQTHAHDGVAGLQQGEVNRRVGLGAGMGLYVGMLRAEEDLCPIPGQILHHVHIFASAVVPVSGVPFCIFIRQMGTHGRHHRGADEVFGLSLIHI